MSRAPMEASAAPDRVAGLDRATVADLAREHGTPLYLLDLDRVGADLAQLQAAGGFDLVRYAQKANGSLALLRQLERAGLAVDAVSAGEVRRALAAGFAPGRIEVTSDVLDRTTLAVVARHGLRANLGSADLIEPYAEARRAARPDDGPDCTLRLNPGFGGGHDRRVTTGGPISKHGIWHAELEAVCERAARAGLAVTGLHMHIGSGVELDDLQRSIEAMGDLLRRAPATVVRASAGGGMPIPYRPTDAPFPVERYAAAWGAAKAAWQAELGRALALEVEPGRLLTARAGALVTEVRAVKHTPAHRWVLVDAGFHTLARPAMYGAHHHVEALVPRGGGGPAVVAGPLCESADVLTQDSAGIPRPLHLPDLVPGDLLVVRDAGAYGLSMASNYNGFPLPAEVVVEAGVARLGRRRQTVEELLALEVPPPRTP